MSRKAGRKQEVQEEGNGGMAVVLEHDALLAILELLPARALASAACVCRAWFHAVKKICSRPCIVSALSLRANLESALREVLEKVLEQPFRPQFAVVFASQRFKLSKIFQMLKAKLPSATVVIGCHAAGLIGLDVATNEHMEVVFQQSSSSRSNKNGLVATLGCLPGVHVQALGVRNSYFEEDVKSFVDQAGGGSHCGVPLSIMLLAKPRSDISTLLEKLDGALMEESIVTGGMCIDNAEECLLSQCFTKEDPRMEESCKLGNHFSRRETELELKPKAQIAAEPFQRHVRKKQTSRHSPNIASSIQDIVGLVFKWADNTCKEDRKLMRCQVAASGALVPIGPLYFVVSVRETIDPVLQEQTTWLTCIREGDDKELHGLALLEDLESYAGHDDSNLCVGIMRHRAHPTQRGQEVFGLYEVCGADDQYLYVDGNGVKTGDELRFYETDAKAARLENIQKLDNLKQAMESGAGAGCCKGRPWKPRIPSEVGALMFSCINRGKAFFHEENVDSSDFLERFPAASLSGMFCLGEIGPACTLPWQVRHISKPQRQTIKNVFSTAFMLYSQCEGE